MFSPLTELVRLSFLNSVAWNIVMMSWIWYESTGTFQKDAGEKVNSTSFWFCYWKIVYDRNQPNLWPNMIRFSWCFLFLYVLNSTSVNSLGCFCLLFTLKICSRTQAITVCKLRLFWLKINNANQMYLLKSKAY